uniref:Uncharacterized protein n=1 Tax=Leersia perrieri TaxID=77586 RepID=A0A0D9V843_9ORYZ
MGGPAPLPAASGLPSDDTHELGGDAVEEDDDDSLRGDVFAPLTPPPPGRTVADGPPPPPRALDRLISLRHSSLELLPLFLLILDHCTQLYATTLATQSHK